MTDINYPQPLSLKDDWKGWVVDHNIKPITTDLTNVNPRKNISTNIPRPSPLPPIGFMTPSAQLGQSISPPKSHMIPGSDLDNDEISEARKTCVSPGIVDSLHPISDDSCMMVTRELTNSNSEPISEYAGENSASDATTKNLTNEYSKISTTGTYDLNNIKFTHGLLPSPAANRYSDNDNASSQWTSEDMELHSYIDVEKYNDDLYWNDYDIWDIKRLYKANHDQSESKDRKIWWDNLYNPYCHDMYEWLDTGLRSNESTMRMTCSYSVGDDTTINNSRKNYVSTINEASDLGEWDAYGGPDVSHPLSNILGNNYILPNKCEGTPSSASVSDCSQGFTGNSDTCPAGCTFIPQQSCENCENKAAVSWDKDSNGIIKGFTGTIEDSTFSEAELRSGFSDLLPTSGDLLNSYSDDSRVGTPSILVGDEFPLIPEILTPAQASPSEAMFQFQEPVVINITTSQAMRFCNENDDCAGFLQYRMPDNWDYLQEGNAKCFRDQSNYPQRQPDIVMRGGPAYGETNQCYPEPSEDGSIHRLSGTFTSNSMTPLDRIKNLFIFKKIIGSSDPNDKNWGPNIEAGELIRPNKYVYCQSGNMNPDIPVEYQNFNTDIASQYLDSAFFIDNKCGEQSATYGDQPNFPRDGGINQESGVCISGSPSGDGGGDWREARQKALDRGLRGNELTSGTQRQFLDDMASGQYRYNSFPLERCRDNNLSPILEHVSGSGSEMDTLLYRNLPAYVYKKKPRPEHTRSSYKLKSGVAGSGDIYDELNADADSKIQSIVDQITDRNQINDEYDSFVDGTFSCGEISDEFLTNYLGYNDNENCTQECKDEIRWKALYNINNCDSANEASADCDCILQARSSYSVRRENCIQHKADLKEYYLNKLEKQNLDDSWNYYKEGTQVNEWWTDTTAISGDDIRPSRIQHPSNIYLNSLGSSNLYDFTGISGLKDTWDRDGTTDGTYHTNKAPPPYNDIFPDLTCCINSIDLTAATGGNIDASNFQQCLSCGSEENPQCNDVVDSGFTGRTTSHPDTTPPPSTIFNDITSFFDFDISSDQNTNNEDSGKSFWEELKDFIKELFE